MKSGPHDGSPGMRDPRNGRDRSPSSQRSERVGREGRAVADRPRARSCSDGGPRTPLDLALIAKDDRFDRGAEAGLFHEESERRLDVGELAVEGTVDAGREGDEDVFGCLKKGPGRVSVQALLVEGRKDARPK